jgi:hypothetical protein
MPTVALVHTPSADTYARLMLLAADDCDCTTEQRAGVVNGSEAHCPCCEARRLLNEMAELIEDL